MTDGWRGHCGRCDWGEFVEGHRVGSCRKLPPRVVVVDGETEAAWPIVFTDDWCGQFSPRRERPWTMQTSAQGDGGGQ